MSEPRVFGHKHAFYRHPDGDVVNLTDDEGDREHYEAKGFEYIGAELPAEPEPEPEEAEAAAPKAGKKK